MHREGYFVDRRRKEFMNINLREEETIQYMLFYQRYLEDVQTLNKKVMDVLNAVMQQSKYDKLQQRIFGIIDAYMETIVNNIETGVFTTWKESEGSLRSCLRTYRAGDAADEVCAQIEQQMEDLMQDILKIEKADLIVTERPVVSEDGLEQLEDICRTAQTEIQNLKTEYTSQVLSKELDNDIYGTLRPLIEGVATNMETFFEASLNSFVELHEFVSGISTQLHNLSEVNGYNGDNLSRNPSSAPNSQTQEQAMAKYIVKKASISYKGENYNVYLLNNDYNVKATRDKDFNLVIYKPEGELNLFNEVYFDSKGNFVTDKKTYTDLRKLYLMGLCKDGLLVDKKYNGTIIPSMIFGKTLTEIGGRAGFTAILTKDPASIGRALTDELKSGFVNQTFASIIWASYEWYGNPSYEGIKKSLDSLYDTKTGIAVTVNNSGIYTISDNYSYHKSLSVDAMFRNWMTAYNRYSVFLKALDDLELTVQGGDNDFETAKEIIKDVGDIFLSAISDDTAEVILNNGTVSDKKLKELIKKYVDLEKVDISFSLNEGLKFSNTKTEFLEGTLSLMDSTLSFKTKYQNMTKNRLSKFEDAADITIGRQDASSVEAHIKNVVGDKDFKMPMKK
jgi:hypothetical protein